ncbi:Uncharacterised protein [Klebsiella pneumoniae]|nr:Uncharacterised protein [Klebsiella pneumoniae]
MLKRLLSKLTGDRQQIERHLKNQYRAEENGSASLNLWWMIPSFGRWHPGLSNWLKKTI